MLTDKQIHDLLVSYVQRNLARDEQRRAAGKELKGSVPDAGEVLRDYEGQMETLSVAQGDAGRQKALGGYYADLVLRSSGLTEPKDSPSYLKLSREVLKAQLEIVETQLSRFDGDYDNPYDSRFSYLADAALPMQDNVPASLPQKVQPSGPLLSEVIERYIRECGTEEKWTEKTTSENKAIYRILLECLGDKQITTYSREDIVGVLEQIKRLPSNSSKQYPGMTIPEILAAPDLPSRKALGTCTIQKYMRRIGSLFRSAYKADLIPKHIAEGINLSSNTRDDEQRAIYTPEDLKRMFIALPLWVSEGVAFKTERFWIPLIGLHSGMRLNEICQLHLDDVKEFNGIWCFDVNEEEKDKRVKTKAGKRCIPVHPVLIEVGLLKYWRQMKDKGQNRLWPGLKHRRDGYGQDFSKRFGKFNRKSVTKDKKKVFHSFRHTLADQLKQQECQEALICQLLGHEYEGSESMVRYGKQYRPSVLNEVMKKVDFGLDVPKLKQFAASL